jgi:hypothetical protein
MFNIIQFYRKAALMQLDFWTRVPTLPTSEKPKQKQSNTTKTLSTF